MFVIIKTPVISTEGGGTTTDEKSLLIVSRFLPDKNRGKLSLVPRSVEMTMVHPTFAYYENVFPFKNACHFERAQRGEISIDNFNVLLRFLVALLPVVSKALSK